MPRPSRWLPLPKGNEPDSHGGMDQFQPYSRLCSCFAIGAGSGLFVGKMDNTEIPKRIAKAAGYK